MLVTDAQVHLWEPSRPDQPWPAGRVVSPGHGERPDGFGAAEMLAAMDEAGVDRAVIVPPSWVGEYNGTALAAAQAHPARFGVMGRFDARAAGAPAELAGWLKQPHMLGIRMTFHLPPSSGWLDDGSLDWFWPAAERLGIPLMMHVPALLGKLQIIAERHPGLTLIVDHLGGVTVPHGPGTIEDLDDLMALSRYPNVLVKATSVPSMSTQPYPYRDTHHLLRRVYDSFGPRRMLWGSDFTRLRGSYRECLLQVQEALEFLSAEDREWIVGKALAAALQWRE